VKTKQQQLTCGNTKPDVKQGCNNKQRSEKDVKTTNKQE
jgi:hypothetical protein